MLADGPAAHLSHPAAHAAVPSDDPTHTIPRRALPYLATAAVILDEQVFGGDPRYTLLAELGGYNVYEAVGRLSYLWNLCLRNRQYVVDETTIRACLGPGGVEAILASGFGERYERGIRVRGTSKRGDIIAACRARYSAKSVMARRAGLARAATAVRVNGQFASAYPKPPQLRLPGVSEPLPANAPPSPPPPVSSPSLPIPIGGAASSPTKASITVLEAAHRDAVSSTWAYHVTRHEVCRVDGFGGGTIPPPRPCGTAADALAQRLRELVFDGGYTWTEAEGICKTRIDVVEAEARRIGHVTWFGPSRVWEERTFWRGVEITKEAAADPPRRRSVPSRDRGERARSRHARGSGPPGAPGDRGDETPAELAARLQPTTGFTHALPASMYPAPGQVDPRKLWGPKVAAPKTLPPIAPAPGPTLDPGPGRG